MTVAQVKQAIENKTILIIRGDSDNWCVPTCLSDCETLVYFKYKGMGYISGNALLCDLSLPKLNILTVKYTNLPQLIH